MQERNFIFLTQKVLPKLILAYVCSLHNNAKKIRINLVDAQNPTAVTLKAAGLPVFNTLL